MKLIILFSLFFVLFSCASKPLAPICPNATESVIIPKVEALKIQGNVSQFLTDAQITQEHGKEGESSVWRFTNMPRDSVYYFIGLRDGDAIYQTNLGPQTSSINLISDLSGISSGTTNCLYVRSKENLDRVIKVVVDKK